MRESLGEAVRFAPFPEVAAVLGISDNAVHVLKSRVKSKLRDLVGTEYFDDE